MNNITESSLLAPPSPIQTMLQLMSGFWISRGIYIAAKLGIADYLADGPKNAQELAVLTNTHTDSLYRVLRMLGTIGVFHQDSDNYFSLTPLSQTLLTGTPGTLRYSAIAEMGEIHYEAWGNLLHTVKTGDIAFDNRFGMNAWEYLEKDPEKAHNFNLSMANTAEMMNAALSGCDVFSSANCLIDVGGGLGGLIAAILQLNPHLSGVVFDGPSVIEKSKEFLAAKGLSDRCRAVGGDFFKAVPAGGDLYLMRWILHDWEDRKSIQILNNIRQVIPAHGKLVLAEAVVPEGNEPHFSKFFDLIMLTMTGGRERTEREFSALLNQTGFKITRIIPTDTFLSLIEAVPV